MDYHSLRESIAAYEDQLLQVEQALLNSDDVTETENLVSLKNDIKQLINLTNESLNKIEQSLDASSSCQSDTCNGDPLENEYALFMSEMAKEGAVEVEDKGETNNSAIHDELKSIEGMKCRAPHKHTWGDVMYHNAIVCSVIPSDGPQIFEDIKVKVMFINPTHQEMLPCPYMLDTDCKFSDELCKYSHGEVVAFSDLQEYCEPQFEYVTIGSKVLAKQSNKLWNRATIKKLYGSKCVVKYDSNHKDLELELHDVLPMGNNDDSEHSETSEEENELEDVINMSLINKPSSEALGNWEKHTKGIGSRIMQQMGYVIGTGLGRLSDGRIEPVSAVILPQGKSLDHCMNLREKAGGDKDLFSVEKKLKRLKKKQELQNLKSYEREKKKVNVFNFLNETLSKPSNSQSISATKHVHRQEIKKETCKSLNVASLQLDEEVKKIKQELYKIEESLTRHTDERSQVHKNLKGKLHLKQNELKSVHAKLVNISNEQNLRSDKKKLTIF